MRVGSLATRLMVVTIAWTSLALLMTGLVLSTLFRQNAERGFEEQLIAHTYNLMGAIDVDVAGKIVGQPNLGDPRFLQPASGWYWAVSKAKAPTIPLIHSRSITNEPLIQETIETVPFNEQFRRTYTVANSDGASLTHTEAQLFLGDGDTVFQVLVAGNSSDLEQAVSSFQKSLWTFFGIFWLGTLAATYFVVWFGLKPLRAATNALVDIREGRAVKLIGVFPKEIDPMAKEINALIESNKSITERARMQVGNLAHALKTPLAVILNESRKPTNKTNEKVVEQADLMQSQIRNYLDRARIAAQTKTLVSRTPVHPVALKLVDVMRKLSPGVSFTLKQDEHTLTFAGEEQDFQEVLGNLLENAGRFANKKVSIAIRKNEGQLLIEVEDDGPGLSPNERDLALQRGRRLDETQPGSGLGLSIVSTISDEYGGSFHLQSSELGGLKAVVLLPIMVYKP